MPAVAEYPSPPVVDLFRGAHSVRWRLEKLMLVVCVVLAPVTIGLVAFTLHEQLAGTALGIFIIVAFAYTAMARGRLLGTNVHVHEKQHVAPSTRHVCFWPGMEAAVAADLGVS